MKVKRLFLVICFLSLFSTTLFTQENVIAEEEAQEAVFLEDAAETGEPLAEENQDTLDEPPEWTEPAPGRFSFAERQRIELELKSSTLPELAVWSRTLGLSESGTRADLARRIREFFEMPEPADPDTENQKILIIESAQATEYFTIETVDEDYARLRGDVRLTLQDSDATHNIAADEILFNRTRNIITARGNVEYTRVKGDTTEIFRGENITVNIDDWSSIFLGGNSEKMLENEGSAYRFEGTVITRNEDDVMILNNARISNAQSEEPYWSINASKLWLLPGSDFAIFNAVLKVGEIPVLYIPFFFFPSDDVIFHPVIGFRSREGAFIQTTTYILGRPKPNPADTSSLARILGNSNDMEKERHGLFLRSTGKKALNPNELSLKALLDYYTNLGAHIGVDFHLPRTGMLDPLDLSIGIGFTRTLSMIDGNYTPYAPNFDGTFDWNHSNLFSESVPFRYRMRMSSAIRGRHGGLSWNIPFYSDPYVDRDFLNRAESMDWLNMIQQGAAMEEDTATASTTDIGAYQWHLNGQIRPSFPSLAPYISNISLSNISMTLAFKTIRDNEIFNSNHEHPGRMFFAPDKYTIYSVSGSLSGTPLSLGGNRQSTTTATTTAAPPPPENPLWDIGIPRSPWPEEEEEPENISTTADDKLIPPVLNQRFDLPRVGNIRFSVDYQLSPAGSSELQFRSGFDRWKTYEDVDWSEVQSILSSARGDASLNFRMDHSEGLFSNTATLSGSGRWQDFSYINEEAEAFRTPQTSEGEKDEERVLAARRQQYSQTNYSTSYAYNGTVRPLYRSAVFGQSNLQYTFGGTMVRSRRYIDGDGPELTPHWGSWVRQETKEGELIPGLTSHRLSSNVAANIINRQQNLTLTADLPPFDPLISTNATFRVWISETNARMEFKKPEMINNEPNEEWKKEPLHLTETLRFGRVGTFSYYMVMDPEEDYEITTITSSLSLWNFRAAFTARKMVRWEFDPIDPLSPSTGGRWIQPPEEEPALNPTELSFTYNRSFSNIDIISNRLSFSTNVNSRLLFNLQQYTNSNFQFTLGFSLRVIGFLDLTLSATSDNKVIFRYFKGIPGMEDLTAMYSDGPQNNLFVDLLDSFNFADESKRLRTGFKMNRFNLSAVHYLGDWKAELGIAIMPYLNNTLPTPKYEVNADISFLVQWSAITEVKSDIRYERRTEKWTVK